MLGGEEGLKCEFIGDGTRFEHVSEFNYMSCVLDESGTDDVECRKKVASGRKLAGAIRYLANGRGLQLKCARLLHERLLLPVLLYGMEK